MTYPLRIAIVGTGPAGLYATGHLIERLGDRVEVDLYERLPVPGGLVRFGVAPDHPEKKLVSDRLFNLYLNRPNVRLMANVEIGQDIMHEELVQWYHGVIYAVGASSDKKMGISGEELPGSWAAREFVAWYNGHPDFANLEFDFTGKRAVIIGNGNVALDVARILTLPISELEKTDIADYALQALSKSAIEEVVLLGRRTHFQGAFNNPELEEFNHFKNVKFLVEPNGLLEKQFSDEQDQDWVAKRKVDTLTRLTRGDVESPEKRIVFRFLSSPVKISGKGRVEQLVVSRNELEHKSGGGTIVRPVVGQEDIIESRLVLRAIGYRGRPLQGLPFDLQKGVIRNVNGRVGSADEIIAGVYVTGWIKRGPRGIIGTNKKCAGETVDHLLADLKNDSVNPQPVLSADDVFSIVKKRNPKMVSVSMWRTIDQFERKAGQAQNRLRVKCTDVGKLLELAHGSSSSET